MIEVVSLNGIMRKNATSKRKDCAKALNGVNLKKIKITVDLMS